MKKFYVLDTNVLLHNPHSVEVFEDNTVVLPMEVIEELDKFKSRNNELGQNARIVIRQLDNLRESGRLKKGVKLPNGGTLRIATATKRAHDELDMSIPVNRIINVAIHLKKAGEEVCFVSKDINARLKADALDIKVRDFEESIVNFDELYTGFTEITVSSKEIALFEAKGIIHVKGLDAHPNQFIQLTSEENPERSVISRALDNETITRLNNKFNRAMRVQPRNREQRMVLELLLNPEIQLVTLVGLAGTGKTLLALAAGLEGVLKQKNYNNLLVSRPIIPLGKDIGYLPGEKDEKLTPWMQPIFDNLNYLMNSEKPELDQDPSRVKKKIDDMMSSRTIEMEAVTYIRGRSIAKQYIIVDEAQNLTPHEVKTFISRAGEGTKVILTGDPHQIDNPYLDSNSNGLTYCVERLKNEKLHGHVTLRKSERSPLAALAARLL